MLATFAHHLSLAAPLFAMVAIGYVPVRWFHWPPTVGESLSRFVFSLALPAMLFRMMSDFSRLPPVDARLLMAFFGGCLIVFGIGRFFAWRALRLDGVAQSVFALGGIFSNNVLLGLPLAKTTLGEASLPSVALVLTFNSLILWTLVSVSIEWAKHGTPSFTGFAKTVRSVATNPIVASILGGTVFGLLGGRIPALVDAPMAMLAQIAAPLSLISLGMGLAKYGMHEGWQSSTAICTIKLVIQPCVVWLLAWTLDIPAMETHVVVLLASLPVGANVYLMAHQFKTLEGPVAASLVISTALAALSVPLVLTLLGAGH
jgi:hypothetical protein